MREKTMRLISVPGAAKDEKAVRGARDVRAGRVAREGKEAARVGREVTGAAMVPGTAVKRLARLEDQ
jgi:hypothetical protein